MFHAYVVVNDLDLECHKYIETFLTQSKVHKIDRLDLTNYDAIGIADVKRLISFLQLRPFASRQKAVILEAELLSLEAQHALLKTMEEPPADSLIFIVAQTEEQLLPTILSRAAIVRLSNLQSTGTLPVVLGKFWSSLLGLHPIRRLTLTSDYAKDRPTLTQWLAQQIIFLRNVLKSKYSQKPLLEISTLELISVIKTVETALKQTKQNVNTKLLVDQLFLDVPWVKSSSVLG